MNYSLRDNLLIDSSKTDFIIWQPEETIIVLGRSDSEESSLLHENVKSDMIPVVKRPSGGHTVILSPQTIVISFLKTGVKELNIYKYFNIFNNIIISALEELGVNNLVLRGTSDICIKDKKILGSSIYKKRESLLYHAVLNTGLSPDFIERYLKHPVSEPDYRNKRKHSSFVTSLSEEGYCIDNRFIIDALTSHFKEYAMIS